MKSLIKQGYLIILVLALFYSDSVGESSSEQPANALNPIARVEFDKKGNMALYSLKGQNLAQKNLEGV